MTGQDTSVKHTDAQYETLWSEATRQYALELFEAVAWRSSFLILVSAVLVLLLARLAGVEQSPGLGVQWLSLAGISLLLLILFARTRNSRQILLVSFLAVCAMVAWWLLIATRITIPGILLQSLFILLIVAVSNLPWPFRYVLALSNVLVCAALCSASLLNPPGGSEWLMVVLALLLLAARSSAISSLDLTSRLASRIAALACQWQLEGITLLKLTAAQLGLLSDSETALLAVTGSPTLVLKHGRCESSSVDEIYVRGLMEKAEKAGGAEGILNTATLGQQFFAPFFDWFRSIPSGVVYHRFSVLVGDSERAACIIIPYTAPLRMAGRRRVLRAVSWTSRVVRLALLAQRSRFVSAGMITASQSSVDEQEMELSRMIHSVNNSSQDMTVIADKLENLLRGLPLSVSDRLTLESEVRKLEEISRTLSAEVSDVKLLREMSSLQYPQRGERVDLESLLNGIEQYGIQRAGRKGWKLQLDRQIVPGAAVSAANRDFLETVLRALIRAAGSHCGAGDEVTLKVVLEAGKASFVISDTGQSVSESEITALTSGKAQAMDKPWGLEHADGILKFVADSQGKLTVTRESSGNSLKLELPAADSMRVPIRSPGGWALLVDDNPEILTFYARIAQALELKAVTAGSLAGALGLLADKDTPRIVITDVHLGDGSGLDLVKALRRSFGPVLPVIVVSGETDTALQGKIRDAGVTRYLVKPVGRKRLFAEIREILGG